ncbi:unnamed protein product, partial [Closterium sp. NIES-54]
VLRYFCSTSGMGLVLGGWGPVVHTGHADASWVDDLATQQSSQGYTFSLGSGSVSWRSTRSSSVLSSSFGCAVSVDVQGAAPAVTAPAVVALPCTRPCRAAPPSRSAPPTEPRRPTKPHCPACTAPAATAATAATLATAPTAAMASPTVLTFDAEGRAVDFDVWVDNLQLFLQCNSRDGVSLFDHTSGVSTAPAATADSTVCSQWTTRDAAARLAVRIARFSSPATAALSRLMLPYLFPDLAAFATVVDLITHLRTSDARYRAALPTEDHFLSLCPTELTVDLLEECLAAAEKSILAVGASRSDPRTPFFEGSGLRLLLVGGAATARARGARVVEGMAGAAAEAVEDAEGVAVEVGVVPGVRALVAAVEVVEAAAEVVEAAAAVVEVAVAVVLVEVQPHSVEALVVASASSSRVPVRPRRPSSFVCGTLGMGGLGVLVPALTFFAPAGVVGRRAGSHTLRSAALVA